jgi:hypothetical protein
MAQKFRNLADLEIVAPSGLVTEGEERRLSNGRMRHASFYVPSAPTHVDAELLRSIEATPEAKPRRRRTAS